MPCSRVRDPPSASSRPVCTDWLSGVGGGAEIAWLSLPDPHWQRAQSEEPPRSPVRVDLPGEAKNMPLQILQPFQILQPLAHATQCNRLRAASAAPKPREPR